MHHREKRRHTARPPHPSRDTRTPVMRKPALALQTTTLWDYPSQHYGNSVQGDPDYVGATPSYVIWNVLQRYSKEGDLVVDPFCGSGTTLDVARDTGRRARGFDLVPSRDDIEPADARSLPLESAVADVVFADPPYGDHIDYSEHPKCIGKLSAFTAPYYQAMEKALHECCRILKPDGHLALYVCDFYKKHRGFAPVAFELFAILSRCLVPIDIIAVTRHNKALKQGNFHKAAAEENFFLRGFNYLFIAQKPRTQKRKG